MNELMDQNVLVVSPRSRVKIMREAHAFLRTHYPRLLRDPGVFPGREVFDELLPQHYGFRPVIGPLPSAMQGLTDTQDKSVTLTPKVYENLENGVSRAIFTAAHETGHVVLHGPEASRHKFIHLVGGDLYARRSEIPLFRCPEWQANTFAAEVLAPLPALDQIMKEAGLLQEDEVSHRFGMSVQAAQYRIAAYTKRRNEWRCEGL